MEGQKDDEEISIDLSKITSFFKRKKKEEVVEVKKEAEGVEKKVEQRIEQEKEKLQRLEKDGKTIEDVKEEIKIEVSETQSVSDDAQKSLISDKKEAEKISREEEKFEKEVKETKEKVEVVKEDIEKEDDEEIAIDFSKIKSFFKRKEPKETKTEKVQTGESDDEEISIDFTKIKNSFKNIFKKGEEKTAEEDAIAIDWKKTAEFIKKYQVVLLLLIPIFLSIFLRVQPAYLPITDDWATDAVMNNLRNQVRSQIDQQFPNLPGPNKDTLVETEVSKLLKEQKSQIQQQITGTSNYFKSRLQDDKGQTYLLAIDPWFWMRYARNIVEKGHPGDEIKNDLYWDNHMVAPSGRMVSADIFHAYFEAYLYKFLSFFNKDLELMKLVFYIPVLLSALAVIPAFFITRRLGGNFGGFIGAFIVAIHPAFLSRTAGGFSDTDAYNVMFPLFIVWLFLEALESKNLKKSIILSSLSGILGGFFAFSWAGWWFIFQLMLVSVATFLLYSTVLNIRKHGLKDIWNTNTKTFLENKNVLLATSSFILFSGIFTTLFKGFKEFAIAIDPLSSLGFARLKEVAITTVWPNVYTTVAEQNPADLNSVINQIGLGKWLFLLIALMGIVLTLTKLKEKKPWFIAGTLAWYITIFVMKPQNLTTFLFLISIPIIIRLAIAIKESDTEIDIKYSIILVLWLISTIYASVKGIRFMLLLVPPFAIGFGIALGQLYRYSSKWFTKGFNINKYISNSVIIIVLLLIAGTFPVPFHPYCLGSTCKSALDTAKREIPSMNDAWYASLTKIKEESAPNAIINSWWDFGHWFKYIGDRAVTFDGTSQNTAMAHWVGHTLLTADENKAVGILRLLDCDSRKAFATLDKSINDATKSVHILHDIVKLDKEKAKEYLLEYIDEGKTKEVLENTHCEPPEDYFITSNDMIGKSGVWAHFGSWDFDRSLIYKTLKSKEYKNKLEPSIEFLQKRFNYSRSEAESLFYEVQSITNSQQANNWIAPWPGYAGSAGCGKVDDETLKCSNYLVNLTTYDIYIPTNDGRMYPKQVAFQTNNDLIIKDYNESVINLQNGRSLGLALIKEGNSYNLLQMDAALTASMFTRLFYMEGIGLKYFKKFSDERSVTGDRIIIWKVDWEGKEKNVIKEPEIEATEEAKDITKSQKEKDITKKDESTKNISNESDEN